MAWYDPTSWNWTGGEAGNSIKGPQNYDAATTQLGQIATSAGTRAAPTMQGVQFAGTQLAGGPQDQARMGMAGVANRLGAIASGQAPGAGELAVNRQVSDATAAQQAASRMARGANAALAYRNAARNTADIGLGGAAQAAQAQMQDAQGANAALAGVYGTMRGQDIDFAGQNAQLGQQAAMQNAQLGQQAQIENIRAQLAQTGMNDAQQIAALGQMLGWDQARMQAEIAKAQLNAGDKGILGTAMQIGGQAAAAYAGK